MGAVLAALAMGRLTPVSAAFMGWMLTLAGWMVSAWLSERAQRRMFLHNIINEESKREASVAALEAIEDRSSDYNALLEDLRVHVQNASLAEITGRRVPERQPIDPNVPITRMRSDGQLEVVQRGIPWPIRTWPPPDEDP